MRRVAVVIALVAACAPARSPPPAPTLHTPAVIAVPPPPPAEACVSPDVEAELACRPEEDRVVPDAPVWPNGELLFHYPPRKTWQSPVLPAIAVSEVIIVEKAAASGQWRAARDAYNALLKTMPKDDPARAWVHARIAQLSENLGQFDDALAAVLAEKDVLRSNPKSTEAEALTARLPAALGRAYARSKRAADEVKGFSDEEIEAIVDGYDDAMSYNAARVALGELITRSEPTKACLYGARRVSTTIEESPARPTILMTSVQEQHKRLGQTNTAACRGATLAVTEEIASAMHIDAVGWNGVPGTSDHRVLAHAALFYDLMAKDLSLGEPSWPPSFAETQRPTQLQVLSAHADLALFQHDFEKCAFEFERVSDFASDRNLRAAAIAKSTRCFERALESRRTTGPMTDFELKFVQAARGYLCNVAADKIDPALARGRVFYRSEQWEKTVAALSEPAFEPGRKEAREAAAIYLVALYRLREATRRPSCPEQYDRDRARLLALHCAGSDADDPVGPLIPGLTTSDPKRSVTPCEAMRNLGAPPPPLPAPPPKASGPVFRGDYTSVSGRTVPQVVAWATRLHEPQFQACYDLALERNPFTAGRESLDFIVGRDGSVSVAKAASEDDQLTDKELHACIMRVASSMTFSQPEGGIVDARWVLELDRVRGAHFRGMPSIRQR